jgi:hypothetical protein
MCDRHQLPRHNSQDTCLGALYTKSEPGVQKHCRFESKAAQELAYQISDLDHMIYSSKPQVHTIYCKNDTKSVASGPGCVYKSEQKLSSQIGKAHN